MNPNNPYKIYDARGELAGTAKSEENAQKTVKRYNKIYRKISDREGNALTPFTYKKASR